jgi:hypothetical protein
VSKRTVIKNITIEVDDADVFYWLRQNNLYALINLLKDTYTLEGLKVVIAILGRVIKKKEKERNGGVE